MQGQAAETGSCPDAAALPTNCACALLDGQCEIGMPLVQGDELQGMKAFTENAAAGASDS